MADSERGGWGKRGLLLVVLGVVLVPCIVVPSTMGRLADIRPDSMKDGVPDAQSREHGRRLLERTAEYHGVARLGEIEAVQFEMTDQWRGMLARVIHPWPDMRAHALVELRVGSFDARATFLDGSKSGHVWGLQAWTPYVVDPAGNVTMMDEHVASFVLPAEQYLVEMALRIRDAERVAFVGRVEVDGRQYDQVYATWGTFEPNSTHDQYLVYLDPETGRLEKGEFTLREKMQSFRTAVHWTDYERVDGLLLPHTITLNDSVEADLDTYLHQIRIAPGTVKTDISVDRFSVDSSLPVLAGEKPGE